MLEDELLLVLLVEEPVELLPLPVRRSCCELELTELPLERVAELLPERLLELTELPEERVPDVLLPEDRVLEELLPDERVVDEEPELRVDCPVEREPEPEPPLVWADISGAMSIAIASIMEPASVISLLIAQKF